MNGEIIEENAGLAKIKVIGNKILLAMVIHIFWFSVGWESKSILYSFNFWINCDVPTGISTRIICGRFPNSGLEASTIAFRLLS